MHRASIAPHQVPASRHAVVKNSFEQHVIARFLSCVEDDPHIHHDVDKSAFGSNERAQIPSLLVEPQTHCFTGSDYNFFHGGFVLPIEPSLPARPEQKAEVVDIPVLIAVLQKPRVVLRSLSPEGIACAPGEDPHHPRQEALTPVGPDPSLMPPFAIPVSYTHLRAHETDS